MELERAQKLADEVVKRLSPYCSRIEVAGSIRRRKPLVRDVDIVLVPSDPWNLSHEISGLGPAKLMGDKLKRVIYNGIQVDLYHCEPEMWGMTLLVRTGSADHNIKLAKRAKRKRLRFAVSRGIENEKGEVIASRTEEEVFSALGLNYIPPEERETLGLLYQESEERR